MHARGHATALLLALAGAITAGEAGAKPAFESEIRPLLAKYCHECHGDAKAKAGINLALHKTIADVQRAGDRWQEVLRVLEQGEMPPKTAAQPSLDERQKLARWIDQTLDAIDGGVRDPGHVVLHRLSRHEYDNSIRDLLGVDTRPSERFPADAGGGSGFDNNADTLFIPPLLMEKLLAAAAEVIAAAKPERLVIAQPVDDKPKSRRDAARISITALVRRAYRRPPLAMDVERVLTVFDQIERSGATFERSLRSAMKLVLVSPNFLFRVEATTTGTQPSEIDHYEMAARLSYFLWSSMPDEELFTLAAAKKLHDPLVIEQQVMRMVADAKGSALGESFASQWLQTERLATGSGPDPKRFPEFTATLRAAMAQEPVAFFNALVREDRSLLHLIDSDYTVVNGDLAAHYGIAGVSGADWREVKLRDANRGGVLGMAGVLAVTSQTLRTSPVARGKWVLEQILDAPPPPPPANIPALAKEEPTKGEHSLRQRLEAHRANPTCASCHDRIDPLGFGLENFDPLGRWRTTDGAGKPIDATGTLITGERFNGPAELRRLLLARKDAFARTMVERMLSYALGRGIAVGDRVTVKEILATLARKGYGARLLMAEIAKSHPFRYRRPQTPVTLTVKPDRAP